jgi:uncharacterized oxidoreductase
MDVRNNTVLITGGSGGIGGELARRLSDLGNVVIVTGRSQAALDAIRQRIPSLRTIQSDAADSEAIVQLYDDVVREFPGLNVVINNAGIMRKIHVQRFEGDLGDATSEIDIDLSGPIRMVMQFLPHLLKQPNGAIINVSSGLAFVPFAISPVYSAAKAGVHAFTRALRVQLKNTNVKVFELAPPVVDTPLNDVFKEDLGGAKLMDVAALGASAIDGLRNDRYEIRPGLANVMKIMSRVAPELILRELGKSAERMKPSMGETPKN